jgi:hypothetical protein
MANRLVPGKAKGRSIRASHDPFDGLTGEITSLAIEGDLCKPGCRHLELHVLPGCFHETGNNPITLEPKQIGIILSRRLSSSCLTEFSISY